MRDPSAAPAAPARPRLRLPAPVLSQLLIFAAWTVYGVAYGWYTYFIRQQNGIPVTALINFIWFKLPDVWLWALLTPPIIALARRFRVTTANAIHRVPLHLMLAIVVHFVEMTVLVAITPWTRPYGPVPHWPGVLLTGLFYNGFVYLGIVAAVHAIDEQRRALHLRTALLETELRLLRLQLQPHFLFNTLHAVAELLHRDPRAAEHAIVRLADLLRWTLQSSGAREVAVRDELAALETYLEIQRLRLGDRVTMSVEADADTLHLGTPSLLLQPLVENALRHGVRTASSGDVRVRVRRDGERLELSVSDDGRGVTNGYREGTGLRATRERLAGLYGTLGRFAITPAPGRGTTVAIVIPARPVGEPAGTAGATAS